MKQAASPATPAFQPRQLAGYLSGAVGMATVLAAPHAQAAVIYWNPADATATTAGGSGFRFDMLDGSVTPVTAYGQVSATGFVFWNGPSADYTFISGTGSQREGGVGGAKLLNLTAGNLIGSLSSFAGARYGAYSYFENSVRDGSPHPWATEVDGTTGYVGLRFLISGAQHYGWARFTYDDATSGNVTLHDFAYEDVAGVDIEAGAIPEPGSALLALAGLGGVALRRRRKAA